MIKKSAGCAGGFLFVVPVSKAPFYSVVNNALKQSLEMASLVYIHSYKINNPSSVLIYGRSFFVNTTGGTANPLLCKNT